MLYELFSSLPLAKNYIDIPAYFITTFYTQMELYTYIFGRKTNLGKLELLIFLGGGDSYFFPSKSTFQG